MKDLGHSRGLRLRHPGFTREDAALAWMQKHALIVTTMSKSVKQLRRLFAREMRCSSVASNGSFGAGAGKRGLMANGLERRAARRFSMMLPLKVRFSAGDGVTEKSGETRDVSFRGLYFLIEASLETGSSIEFVLTLPQQITLAGDVHIRCYARVVRVESHNGRRGVAARIERYEFLPAAA